MIVRVGTLDEDPDIKPAMRIWTSHDVPWLLDADEAARYPEWPPGH